MMTKRNSVRIKKGDYEVIYSLRNGLRLNALKTKEDTAIKFDYRKADCGICIFNLIEGMQNVSPINENEQGYLKALKAGATERLACQTEI
jgi:ferredoxin